MAAFVHIACALTSLLCALMLWNGYRKTRIRLLFWSALCFALMALGNMVLVVDLNLLHGLDLRVWRALPHLTGALCLVYGLVWETR